MKRLTDEAQRRGPAGRRCFLKAGALAGIGAVVAPALARADAAHTAAPAPLAPPPFELEEVTAAELQEAMRAGRLTSKRITQMYLERIGEIDHGGVSLRSVIEVNPEALDIADGLDRERRAGRLRGPLHGLPVLIKDNIDTADRMMTTAGSLALVESRPAGDAHVAARLREAGAVILGKTNLSEWANFRSTRSTSGWSARGGQTLNPYALDRNPCGSSSGSGAAVAANLCFASVGTETDGSIVCPSSANGIVGIKPTLGLVSRAGIIPISHSQDTAGPMARTVADAAALLTVISGYDSRDPAERARGSAVAPSVFRVDYTRFLDPAGLRGARVGVARKFFGFNDRVDALMNEALDAMKRAGATLIDPADLPTHGQFDASEFEVLLYEFKHDLNRYLAGRPGRHPRTLKELIEFNERNKAREMPYFGQELFHRAEAKGPLTEAAYRAALRKNRLLAAARGVDAVTRRHRLDALVAPTGGPAWKTDLVNGDHFTGGSSSPAAVAGYPAVTVPAGFVHGLPVGVSFFGRAFTEGRLIRLAYAFERLTKHRRPPRLLPAAALDNPASA
jgi:amidase